MLLTVPGVQVIGAAPTRLGFSSGVASTYRDTVVGDVNAWWDDDPNEVYRLEITDRPDIGVDLHAPQRDSAGMPSPGYSLIWWVKPGDIVFHYDRNQRAIVSWSSAVGQVEEAPVIWLSHRAATRRRLGVAAPQPGWWLDLEGPFPLPAPVTLSDLRLRGEDVRCALAELRERHEGSLYFPFFFYRGTELRPMQPYLNKLPAAVVRLFSQLTEVAKAAPNPFTASPRSAPASVLSTELLLLALCQTVATRSP